MPVLWGGFLLSGAASVLLGPWILEIRLVWGLSPSQVALFFVTQFAASSAGAVLSSRFRWSLPAGYAFVSLGLFGLAAGRVALATPALGLMGLGLGLSIPATNLLVARRDPSRRGAALSHLNLVWVLGAVGCPLLFEAVGRAPLAWLLGTLGAATALVALALGGTPTEVGRPADPPAPGAERPGRDRVLVWVAAQMFLYVGTEGSISGWIVSLADEIAGDRGVGHLVGAAFWAALLAGRALAPAVLRRMSEDALHRAGLAVAGAGAVGILAAGSGLEVALAAALAGLGLAPLFPLLVSTLATETAARRSREAGSFFALAGLGGAALPWLAGRVAGATGMLQRGFLVPAAGVALMALFLAVQRAPSLRDRSGEAPRRAPRGPPRGGSPGVARPLPRSVPSGLAALLVLSLLGAPVGGEPQDPSAAAETALAEAEAFLRDGETQAAESRYRTALSDAFLLTGALDAAEGAWTEAKTGFERASTSAVESPGALTSLALVELQRGETGEAVLTLSRVVARHKGGLDSRRLLAQALLADGRTDEAVQELEEARASAPGDPEIAFALARGYLRARRVETAEKLLADVLRQKPLPQTHVLIGRTYRDFGEYDRAQAALEAALKLDPRVRRGHYYLGTVELMRGGPARLQEAIALFREELRLAPQDSAAQRYLGMCLVEARQYGEALPPLETSVKEGPPSADALFFLGRCYLGLGRSEEGASALRRALELASARADEGQLAGIHHELAFALTALGRQEEAAPEFALARSLSARDAGSSPERPTNDLAGSLGREARSGRADIPSLDLGPLVALGPGERSALRRRCSRILARSYFNLGILQAQAGRPSRAAEFLEQAAGVDPDFPQVQFSLGVAYFNAERFDKATGPLSAALERSPGHAQARRLLALAWLHEEAYDKAAHLLGTDPQRQSDPSLEYAYGVALVRSGHGAEAQEVFRRLLAARGDSAELNLVLGQAQVQQGDFGAAIRSLERAREIKADLAGVNASVGEIYLRQGHLPEAEAAFRAEVQGHPQDAKSLYELATVLDLEGRSEEALGLLGPLLKQQPGFSDARYLLGKILLARGHAREAQEQLEAAARLAPEEPNVRYQLGLAYQKLGRAEEARQQFELFRQLKDKRRGNAS